MFHYMILTIIHVGFDIKLQGLMGDSADEYLAALRTVIRCIRDPKKYYAKVHIIINQHINAFTK